MEAVLIAPAYHETGNCQDVSRQNFERGLDSKLFCEKLINRGEKIEGKLLHKALNGTIERRKMRWKR